MSNFLSGSLIEQKLKAVFSGAYLERPSEWSDLYTEQETAYYQINWFPQFRDWEWSFTRRPDLFGSLQPTVHLAWIRRLGPLEIRKLVKRPDNYDHSGPGGLPGDGYVKPERRMYETDEEYGDRCNERYDVWRSSIGRGRRNWVSPLEKPEGNVVWEPFGVPTESGQYENR